MTRLVIRPSTPEDNDALLSLTRRAYVKRKFSLSLDRGTRHWGLLQAASDSYETLVAVDPETGTIHGYGDSIDYRVKLEGDSCLINYGAMGVVDPAQQGRRIGRRLFQRYVEHLLQRRVDGYYIVTNPRNRLMNTFVKTTPGLQTSRAWRFQLNYVLFSKRYSPSREFGYRRAVSNDLPEVAELIRSSFANKFFYPEVSADSLRATIDRLDGFSLDDFFVATRRGKLVAVLALWDQKRLKQVKLVDCSLQGRAIRVYLNARARLCGFTPLPQDGEFYAIYQTMFVACEGSDPAQLGNLIKHVCNEKYNSGYQFMNLVCCTTDPLLGALEGIYHLSEENLYHLVMFNKTAAAAIPPDKSPYLNYSFS